MLTLTHPPAPEYRIDGVALRETLTGIWEDSSGDTSDLRRKCVAVLKDALDLARASVISSTEKEKGGLRTAHLLAQVTDEVVAARPKVSVWRFWQSADMAGESLRPILIWTSCFSGRGKRRHTLKA
jgi:hypothetical protein